VNHLRCCCILTATGRHARTSANQRVPEHHAAKATEIPVGRPQFAHAVQAAQGSHFCIVDLRFALTAAPVRLVSPKNGDAAGVLILHSPLLLCADEVIQ
jgi:hypothetical protein